MTTVSPGSTKLTKEASIPELPVAEMARVVRFLVLKSPFNISLISSMHFKISGSRYPITGVDIA
jgi:hypothetical protein